MEIKADMKIKEKQVRTKLSKKELRKNLIAYSFILPNFLGFAIFTLIPMIFAFALAFLNWDGSNPITFAGLDNFKHLFKDSTFKISIINTIYYSIGTVPLTLAASLGIAILLNKKIFARNFFRTVFFFPYVASLIAVAVVWNMIFNPSMGIVNSFLTSIGVANPPGWTSSTVWAMPVIIFVSIWKNMGYYMVIYLAALQGIPAELYEAASLDGANSWQKFKNVTLPMLTPTTFFVSIMLTISCFKVFDFVYMMTQGGPGRSTMVLVYHIYNTAFKEFAYGYSSAMSMVLFVIVLAITIFQFRAEKKWVSYM
ncbi:carbohydrate ABC transporter permease [Clostridium beijerinckii]|uniref:Lactose transport system permease protein LacF n=1 Tax=Clostridium beijerinckii TaxID=1520 RepID=A0A1S8SEA3_CLOBE|nr:sugar ABC transporter permease [Clostridium beijerinckii]NRY60239.1 multiple sugar transport system permease protein [Clostridium beijerinckii]OOM63435.1 lactose transport system permease protein LacF [Clostridium beijerinckii]